MAGLGVTHPDERDQPPGSSFQQKAKKIQYVNLKNRHKMRITPSGNPKFSDGHDLRLRESKRNGNVIAFYLIGRDDVFRGIPKSRIFQDERVKMSFIIKLLMEGDHCD